MKLTRNKLTLLERARQAYEQGNYRWETEPDIKKAIAMLEQDWSGFDDAKYNRWLGFAQALLWRCDVVSLDEMKRMVRREIEIKTT